MEPADSTELKIAAAAVAGAVAPPLGVAVAAGAALRSPRVRNALRSGAVRALGSAMQAADEVSRRSAPGASADDGAGHPSANQ